MANSKAISKYSSILTWANFLREVQSRWDYKGKDVNGDNIYEHTEPYPTIEFDVTHKIGGCNMSIGLDILYNHWFYQSRDMLLDNEDYAGFKQHFISNNYENRLRLLTDKIISKYDKIPSDIIIYGEWCGKGIPEKACISKTENKKWIIFAIKVNGEYINNFIDLQDNEIGIYNILQFENFKYSIDFNQFEPLAWQNKEIPDFLTQLSNEKTINCPISKSFGVEGLGEGLVFTAYFNGYDYKLKVKNNVYEKADVAKQVKEVIENPLLDKFVEEVCTENRLEQFSNKLLLEQGELLSKHIPIFLSMIVADIDKEEQIAIDKLDDKNRKWVYAVQTKAKNYFIKLINS